MFRVLCELGPSSLYLDERAHVGEVRVHGAPVREVTAHALHQLAETAVRLRFCNGNTSRFGYNVTSGFTYNGPSCFHEIVVSSENQNTKGTFAGLELCRGKSLLTQSLGDARPPPIGLVVLCHSQGMLTYSDATFETIKVFRLRKRSRRLSQSRNM